MTTRTTGFGPASLEIDAEVETARITAALTAYLARSRRRGLVVALSGGIDSSTVAALCVAALGKDRVFGLHMPEQESSPDTLMLSRLVADSLGIASTVEEISPILEGTGCYRRRDDAIRTICPKNANCRFLYGRPDFPGRSFSRRQKRPEKNYSGSCSFFGIRRSSHNGRDG